ncbi:MAG TPA: M1 family aminopeptidase, partial [Candidatus Polarisedimenticolia bacterium]|nr:M1 family aminopeptidase [Candidatus Polarisedimenticolia bacterium]
LRVTLPQPLAPDGRVTLALAFVTKLASSELSGRGGFFGDHFDGMQWFPKLAALRHGTFDAEPFHADTEFFADFGTYDVTISAPRDYLVEATGVPLERRDNPDGSRSVTFRAEDVHDFAFIADRNAVVARELFSEGPYASHPVEILYVHQPYRRVMAPRILAAVKEGLLYYGQRLMPYPYPRLVVDDLPMGLGGGMEYPMLFTVSMAWFLPRFETAPEEVTLHEFGHQYWYGIVATNEFEEPWLDEGINSYVTRRAMDHLYGRPRPGRTVNALFDYALTRILDEGVEARLGPLALNLDQLLGFQDTPFRPVEGGFLGYPVSPFDLNRPGLAEGRFLSSKEGYAAVARDDALATPSWGFRPGSYVGIVYDKTDVVLETLARLLGPDRVDAALAEYVRRYRFAHPTAREFLEVLAEEAARGGGRPEVAPLVQALVYDTGTVDFAVESLRSRESAPARGFIPAARAGEAATDRRAPPEPAGSATRYETEVIVRRLGDLALPVDILVRFENGEERRETWDGRSTWKRFTYETGARADRAIIDPGEVYALDLDRNNNSLTLDRRTRPVARLVLLWHFWIQNYLHLAAALS